MKALLLSEEEIDPTDSTSVIESKSKSDVFTATLNVGLGRCNVKVGDYESAIDYLKAGAGYLTDSIFVKPLKPQRKIPFESSLLIKTPTPALPEDVSTLKNRVVSFSVVRVEATHLLNALESLSDAYAAQRDWEKAIYTANNTLDVCRALLSAVSVDEKGCIMSSVKFQDSEEATLIDDIGKNIKNKNFIDNNNNNNTSVTSCPNSGLSTTVLKMTIRDDYLSILTGKIDKSDSNSDTKDFDLERKHLSTALCKRRASTLLAMGHMVKQILYHDINRGTDQDSIKSTGYMFSTIDHNLGNESMRFVGDTADSSDYATTTTAVDRITTLWADAAEEFKRLGDYNQMVSVNKDIAALWSSLARVEAYSMSLILVDDTSTDISLNEHEASAYLPTESNPRNDASPDNITQHSSKMIPLRSDSNENILRIEAARKASTGWKCTADIARDLCKMASAVGDTNAGLPTGHTTDQSKFDSTVAELELLGWQQVMRCLYNAGLCAMLYDMKESEKLFESAHETKLNYHAIAGLLADVEKEQKRNVPSIDLNEEKSSEDTDTFRKLLLKKKENWLNYNTLCCDISYHLGYAYIRSEKIAYAIAEAEMAIEFSLYSAESKLRKRKCWGLLSMGLSASGQIAESEKAFKEIRSVCEDMEVTNLEISQLREFNEYWKDRRNKKHSLSVPSIKSVPVSDRQTPVKVNKLDSAKDNVYKMDKADYDGLVRLMMVSFISLLVLIIAIAISFR